MSNKILDVVRHNTRSIREIMALAKEHPQGEAARAKAQAFIDALFDMPLQAIGMAGPPDPRFNNSDEITAMEKRIAKNMVNAEGKPIEKTVEEIRKMILGSDADPQSEVNLKYVLTLMKTPPAKKYNGERGHGYLNEGSGDKRSQAYYITRECAERFGLPYKSDEVVSRPAKVKTSKEETSESDFAF